MIDYIVEGVCLLLCVLHFLHGLLNGRILSKKIDTICSVCGMPVTDGDKHKCDLTSAQLKALYDFVLSLKSDKSCMGDSNDK